MPQLLYKVEKIVGKRINAKTRKLEYRVKWVGYPPEQNTWQPISHLKLVPEMVQAFEDGLANKSKLKQFRADPYSPQVSTPKTPSSSILDKIRKTLSKHTKQLVGDPFSSGEDNEKINDEANDEAIDKASDKASNKALSVSKADLQMKMQMPVPQMTEGEQQNNNFSQEDQNFTIVGMYRAPGQTEFCFEVRENGNRVIMTREKLLQINWKALLHFYQKNIQFPN